MSLDRATLTAVSQLVEERLGLAFPEGRWTDLERGLAAASVDFGLEGPAACAGWLRTATSITSEQLATLARYLTVGETYFWRDAASFEALERLILPAVRNEGRTVRMWSAGCSTGEEAWSLAIASVRAGTPQASILATDCNTSSLTKARAGVYTAWSFRDVPGWLQRDYFRPSGQGFEIAPELRERVHFAYLNLADDVYPSPLTRTDALDVIFCRNVLMYLTPAQQTRVVAAFRRCLREGGWLFVSACESYPELFADYAPVEVAGQVAFQKTTTPPVQAAPPPPPRFRPAARPPKLQRPPANLGETAPLLVARAQANQGQLALAEEACQQALARNPTDPVAHYLWATIQSEQGLHREAAAALTRVLYLDPNFVLAHFTLGSLHRQLGNTQESARHLAAALELARARPPDELIPEAEGLTFGRLVADLAPREGARLD